MRSEGHEVLTPLDLLRLYNSGRRIAGVGKITESLRAKKIRFSRSARLKQCCVPSGFCDQERICFFKHIQHHISRSVVFPLKRRDFQCGFHLCSLKASSSALASTAGSIRPSRKCGWRQATNCIARVTCTSALLRTSETCTATLCIIYLAHPSIAPGPKPKSLLVSITFAGHSAH